MRRPTIGVRIRAGVLAPVCCLAGFATPVPAQALPEPSGRFLQIVAHQDDELLFMNPDVHNAVDAGRPVATVYLTAGENDNDPVAAALSRCRERGIGRYNSRDHYVSCRQEGVRAAWAAIAGVPNVWSRRAVSVAPAGGAATLVEIDELSGTASPVSLVFLNLPEAADEQVDSAPDGQAPAPVADGDSLERILTAGATRRTIVPTGGAVDHPIAYDRTRLVGTLVGLLEMFRPTVVRIQDDRYDTRYRINHDDHVHGARLAVEALRTGYDTTGVQLLTYRDYNIADMPINLPAEQIAEKRALFGVYREYDERIDAPGASASYEAWPQRQHQRWPGGTRWAARNQDGRVQAFAVLDGRLSTWWQALDGSWQGPRDLGAPGGGWLAPWVSVVTDADGRLAVCVLDLATFHTVMLRQSVVNGGWSGAWVDLGNPNGGLDPDAPSSRTGQVGPPTATVDRDGRIHVFQRNGGGGISTRAQATPGGALGPWTDLRGTGVQDGLSAALDAEGRLQVFALAVAAGVGRITHWRQTVPGGPLTLQPSFPAAEPAGPPTVATGSDGRLSVFYPLATNPATNGEAAGTVGHTRQSTAGGAWTTGPLVIGGHGGTGAVAAADAPSAAGGSASVGDARIVLFQRNGDGGLSTTRQTRSGGGFPSSWTDTGGLVAQEPTVIADRSGAMVALAIDGGGRLVVSGQTSPTGGADFTEWVAVG